MLREQTGVLVPAGGEFVSREETSQDVDNLSDHLAGETEVRQGWVGEGQGPPVRGGATS